MGKKLNIERLEDQGTSILALKGYLDLHTASELEAAIQTQIQRKKFRIIVDCAELSYISSAGLGVFMSYIDEVRENQGDIVICQVGHEKVRQVFELVNFGELFDIVADREEATAGRRIMPAQMRNKMSFGEFSLAVPASLANLAMIRGFVCQVGDQAGFSRTQINRLELAVDEACSNVIEHGNRNDASNKVTVKAGYDEDTIRVAIIDAGVHFNPQEVKIKSLEVKRHKRKRRPVRGLGIPMLKSLLDHIDYHVLPDNRNELELVLRKA